MKDRRHVEAHRPFDADGDLRAFLARFPDVEAIDLSGCSLADHQIDELHGYSRVEAVRLDHNFLTESAVERLWAAPFRLHELSLRGNEIGDAGWRAIADSQRAGDLETLDLADSWFEAVSISAFAASPFLHNLRSLDWSGLWQGAIEEDEAAALRNAGWMRAIRRLGLDRSFINGAAMMRLVETPLFEELTELRLRQCHLGWDDGEVLGSAPVAQTLVDLDIRENDLGASNNDDCWNWLAGMPCLRAFRFGAPRDRGSLLVFDEQWKALFRDIAPRLRAFGACNAGMEPRLIAELVGVAWPELDTLDLSDNVLGDDGLRLLAASSFIARVHSLTLANCRLETGSMARLVAAGMPLIALDLSDNSLGGSSTLLLRSAAAAKVESVSLTGTGLTDADLEALASSPFLGALRSLDISENPVTQVGIEALIQSSVLTSLERVRFSVPATFADDELARLHDASLSRGIALQALDPGQRT